MIAAAREFNVLRSRAPEHGEELFAWVDAFMRSIGLNDESAEEEPVTLCRLSLGRYRLARSSRLSRRAIAQHDRECIDRRRRSSRPRLHRAAASRSATIGLEESNRAGAARGCSRRGFSIAPAFSARRCASRYIISAATPGVLPRTPMLCARGVVNLTLPPELADLASERLQNRLQRLARVDRTRCGDPHGSVNHATSWLGASRHSSVATLPFSTVSARRPALVRVLSRRTARAASPMSAATSALSLAAIASRSSTVAIIFAATPWLLGDLAQQHLQKLHRRTTTTATTLLARYDAAGFSGRARARARSRPKSRRRRASAPSHAETTAGCRAPRRRAAPRAQCRSRRHP